MIRRLSLSKIALAIAPVVAVVLAGCSSQAARDVRAANQSNIQRVGNLYAAYQNYHEGKGPPDEATFIGFVAKFDKSKLEMMGIDPSAAEKIFSSDRDGKPLKIRYGVGGGKGSVDPVAFEQEGKNGKKQVGFTGGKVEEVDDAAYAQLWEGKAIGGSVAPKAANAGRPSGRPEGAPTGPGGG